MKGTLCGRLAAVKTPLLPATQDPPAAVIGLLNTYPRSLASRLKVRPAQPKQA